MADNKINVTVSANTRKNITVSSAQQSTEITASTDTGRFWAQTSKNWAVSDVIVDNTDYSSKHYAQEAKESAISAGGFETSTRETYNSFLETSANAIESMNTVKTEAIDSLNSTKTTILNDIEFVANGEKKEIEELIDSGKEEIQELADEIRDSGDTVNTAIEAGVERLNSIDSLKKSQITNCLLEVPQRIKYTLSNGTLTIKAGSVVIVPYGTTNENFTKVGSPTIVNGVSSGFSNQDYIGAFDSSLLASPFEFYFGFTATNVASRQALFGMQTAYGLNIGIEDGKLMFGASSLGAGLDIAENIKSSLTINTNTKYLGRLKWTGTVYTLSLYINNDWVDYITVNNSNAILGERTVNIGLLNNVYPYVNGSIDLKQLSLTVNGKVVYRPYLQKGDTFLNDNFKVYDTCYSDGKFFVWAELVNEVSTSSSHTQTNLPISLRLDSGNIMISATSASGTATPTAGNTFIAFYNTTENKCYADGTNVWIPITLPLMIVDRQNDIGVSNIRQVFNGMGYIGSTIWVDKGVKGLIPNGRNADGSLKNIEIVKNKLQVITYTTDMVNLYFGIHSDSNISLNGIYSYNKIENYAYNGADKVPWLACGKYDVVGGKVTNFQPKQTFRAVDYSDSSTVSGWGMPSSRYIDLTLGASGSSYTAPANGWVTIFKYTNGANQAVELGISNSIRYSSIQPASGGICITSLPVRKGQNFYCVYSAGGSLLWFRFIYAEGAY